MHGFSSVMIAVATLDAATEQRVLFTCSMIGILNVLAAVLSHLRVWGMI